MRAVVIGAGVMGAWTALELRRGGHEVTLVDAYGAGNSLASSGDETRITRSAHGSDRHYPAWQRAALAAWRSLEADLGTRLLVPTGAVWLAHRDDGFEAESLEVLAELGIPVERVEPDAAERRWDGLSASGVSWLLHEPEAGALMARRAVAAVAGQVAAEGGSVLRGLARAPVAEAATIDRVDLTDGRVIEAEAAVFACGPWLAKLFPELMRGQLEVTQQEILYVATPAGDDAFDAGRMPIWVDYDRAFYGIPSIEGRGFKVAPDWPGPRVDPDKQERRLSDARIEAGRAYLSERFPRIARQPIAEGRVCQYETTPDTHFIIDRHPALENAWIVGGGSGHGFKHGPLIGRYVAALVAGDRTTASELDPGDGRFRLGTRRGPATGMRTSGMGPDWR